MLSNLSQANLWVLGGEGGGREGGGSGDRRESQEEAYHGVPGVLADCEQAQEHPRAHSDRQIGQSQSGAC